MPLVELPGVRLAYEDTGGPGRPVVFVHAASGTSAGCPHQLPAFTQAGYRCITYDLRGWGRSEPTSADSGIMSDDLAGLVDHLGLDRFVLLATAYGGFGGLDFALRFPERLLAFVLATSQGGLADPEYVAGLRRAVPAEIRQLPLPLRELGPSYRLEDPDGVQRWETLSQSANHDPEARQQLALRITLPLLETLRVPTLLLAAGADLLAPPALMRQLAARIPHAQFTLIPDAGHAAHWERPTEWNAAVLTFLHTLP